MVYMCHTLNVCKSNYNITITFNNVLVDIIRNKSQLFQKIFQVLDNLISRTFYSSSIAIKKAFDVDAITCGVKLCSLVRNLATYILTNILSLSIQYKIYVSDKNTFKWCPLFVHKLSLSVFHIYTQFISFTRIKKRSQQLLIGFR